jgi:hypothetical protein
MLKASSAHYPAVNPGHCYHGGSWILYPKGRTLFASLTLLSGVPSGLLRQKCSSEPAFLLSSVVLVAKPPAGTLDSGRLSTKEILSRPEAWRWEVGR